MPHDTLYNMVVAVADDPENTPQIVIDHLHTALNTELMALLRRNYSSVEIITTTDEVPDKLITHFENEYVGETITLENAVFQAADPAHALLVVRESSLTAVEEQLLTGGVALLRMYIENKVMREKVSWYVMAMRHESIAPLNAGIAWIDFLLAKRLGDLAEEQETALQTIRRSAEQAKLRLPLVRYPVDILTKQRISWGHPKEKPSHAMFIDITELFKDFGIDNISANNKVSAETRVFLPWGFSYIGFEVMHEFRHVDFEAKPLYLTFEQKPEEHNMALLKIHVKDSSATQNVGLDLLKDTPISQTLIEQNGGQLWWESEPGVSTTIYMTFPIVPDDEAAE